MTDDAQPAGGGYDSVGICLLSFGVGLAAGYHVTALYTGAKVLPLAAAALMALIVGMAITWSGGDGDD